MWPTSKSTTTPPVELVEGFPKELAERHAKRLLRYMTERWPDHLMDSRQVQREYKAMCSELNVLSRPWNQVGEYLTDLTRVYLTKSKCRKRYVGWVDEKTGKRKLYRVYKMPPSLAALDEV